MEQAYLKERLLYSPKSGVFYWILPPSGHADMLGEEAGTVAGVNGKRYHIIQIDGAKYKRAHLAWLYMTGKHHEEAAYITARGKYYAEFA